MCIVVGDCKCLLFMALLKDVRKVRAFNDRGEDIVKVDEGFA